MRLSIYLYESESHRGREEYVNDANNINAHCLYQTTFGDERVIDLKAMCYILSTQLNKLFYFAIKSNVCHLTGKLYAYTYPTLSPRKSCTKQQKTQNSLFSHSSGISFIQVAAGGDGYASDFGVGNVVDQVFLLLPACLPV